MDLINIPISYLESSLDTTYPISPESLLDKPMVARILRYAAETFGRELKLSEECVMPFNVEASDARTYDNGQPKMASAFTGKFLLSLKQEEHTKGFPFLVKRIEEEHKIVHTQLVDLKYSQDENSGKKEGKKEGKMKAGNHPCISIAEGKQNSNLADKVEVLTGETLELKGKVEVMTREILELKGKVEVLSEQVEALQADQRVFRAVRLRIAMEDAHKMLMEDLSREPGPESTWADFMQSITPAEKTGLLHKVSQKALDLMVTEKKN